MSVVKLLETIESKYGTVELWDFSKANLSEQNRINAITNVASICYQNPKAINSDSLYNRLMAESIGLPSSSFEFVPVLISESDYWNKVECPLLECPLLDTMCINNPLTMYGEWVMENDKSYLITNYRAVLYTKELYPDIDLTDHFNTESECEIISKHFNVFKFKVDSNTRTQMIRHRVIWQELSRRYVDSKRVPFEFYISEKLSQVVSSYIHTNEDGHTQRLNFTTEDIHRICENHYNTARNNGVKPEEARRIIPQSMTTTLWCGMHNRSLLNFLKLRTKDSAQVEIRNISKDMNTLLSRHNKVNIELDVS